MSGRKRQGADLIVRVRYQNPLPPPPFPPRMLTMATAVDRFADFESLRQIENDREAPLTLDAELGMPLIPGNNEVSYWLGDRSAAQMEGNVGGLDDQDRMLLVESAAGLLATQATNGPSTSIKTKSSSAFLRRAERLEVDSPAQKEPASQSIDVDDDHLPQDPAALRAARIKLIEASFDAVAQPLSSISHPTRPAVKAAQEYAMLPDHELYANTYQVIRYPDDPRHPLDTKGMRTRSDVVTQTALLRPIELPDDDPRVAYYLPSGDHPPADEGTEEYGQLLRRYKLSQPYMKLHSPQVPWEDAPVSVRCIRHYESAGKRDLANEFLLSIDDGVPLPDSLEHGLLPPRPPGAYFVPIKAYQPFRVRRARKGEPKMEYGELAASAGTVAWAKIELMSGINQGLFGSDDEELAELFRTMEQMSQPPAA